MLHDYVISMIRTTVPVAVAAVLAWLASRVGFVLDDESSTRLVVGAVAVATMLYYGLVRAAEARWPIFGVLLGKPAAPVYDLPPAQTDSIAEYDAAGNLQRIRSNTVWPPKP